MHRDLILAKSLIKEIGTNSSEQIKAINVILNDLISEGEIAYFSLKNNNLVSAENRFILIEVGTISDNRIF